MPKCGKLSKGELKWYLFLKLQKGILLNGLVGFKVFTHSKYSIDHSCLCTHVLTVYWPSFFVFISCCGPWERFLPLTVSLRGCPAEQIWALPQEPECLGSFPYSNSYFSCDPEQVIYALYETMFSSLYMKISNGVYFFVLLKGYNGWKFTHCEEWILWHGRYWYVFC